MSTPETKPPPGKEVQLGNCFCFNPWICIYTDFIRLRTSSKRTQNGLLTCRLTIATLVSSERGVHRFRLTKNVLHRFVCAFPLLLICFRQFRFFSCAHSLSWLANRSSLSCRQVPPPIWHAELTENGWRHPTRAVLKNHLTFPDVCLVCAGLYWDLFWNLYWDQSSFKVEFHFQDKNVLIIYSPQCHPRYSCLSFFSRKEITITSQS